MFHTQSPFLPPSAETSILHNAANVDRPALHRAARMQQMESE
jgi:hypothetical protein